MIGITGDSGVGKSTIAEIISLYFGIDNTVIISTDDLHKWERNNIKWNEFTHLNPDANNLDLGDIHIQQLSSGNFIFRSSYDHNSGYFKPPIKINPKSTVVVEGLHAFYTPVSKQLLDTKIFVDTNDDLRIHWKIIRDTEERGYTYNSTLDAINKRKKDSQIIRSSQFYDADVVIELTTLDKIKCIGNKHEDINLIVKIHFKKNIRNELFDFILNYINTFNEFKYASEFIGKDIFMCQDSGGNISCKISNKFMFIKASGFSLKNSIENNGYSLVDYSSLNKCVEQKEFENSLPKSVVLPKYKKPSMETGFHMLLKKYVIHVHPIYLLLILSLEGSKNIIYNLFNNKLDYEYVAYFHPGFNLYDHIRSKNFKEVYFLENHGIIISSDCLERSMALLKTINDIIRNYLIDTSPVFEDFSLEKFSNIQLDNIGYIFPDAVVFSDDKIKLETLAAHNYIISQAANFGTIRFLSNNNIFDLKHLESEKYRRNK
jgi:uridine kinase/ribulose-5-phosphate 4-epimerase/fuculose-1-phosphate aldolase